METYAQKFDRLERAVKRAELSYATAQAVAALRAPSALLGALCEEIWHAAYLMALHTTAGTRARLRVGEAAVVNQALLGTELHDLSGVRLGSPGPVARPAATTGSNWRASVRT